MIYDCFAFFNELDLLKIRLNELDKVVDKFVLVEATRTFQKKEKPLYFNENKHLFKEFEHKIIHIIVDKYPNFWNRFKIPTIWDYDNHQKEQILQGLLHCKDEDIIIVSDLDEIPRADKIQSYAYTNGVKVFEQRLFFYYLNGLCTYVDAPEGAVAQYNRNEVGYWRGSVMLSFEHLKNKVKTIQKVRSQRDLPEPRVQVIQEGGWHFSFLGGVEKILQKINAYAHPEVLGNHNEASIRQATDEGKSIFDKSKFDYVPIDDSFPLYIKQRLTDFLDLIK
jgi:beta-1,4-mannosyl-glycoprotein beta-1,4-N-acetylglucosaminyltransferase